MIPALAPLLTLEAGIGPAGWLALGGTILGASIASLIKSINQISERNDQNQQAIDALNSGLKQLALQEAKIRNAIANLDKQTSPYKPAQDAINKLNESLKNLLPIIDEYNAWKSPYSGDFFTMGNYGPTFANNELNFGGKYGNEAQWNILLNGLQDMGVITSGWSIGRHVFTWSSGATPDRLFIRDLVTTIDWDALLLVLTGIDLSPTRTPTSATGIGTAIGTPTIPLPPALTDPWLLTLILAGGVVTSPTLPEITIPTNEDYISPSIDLILISSIWWNRVRTGTKTGTKTPSVTRTGTKKGGKPPKRPKKPKKLPKQDPKKPIPETIREIYKDVSNVSEWIRAVSFKFPTRQPKDSDARGTLTFHLKKGSLIRFVRVKRGTFSVIADYYGTGYRLWSQFWKHKIVNRWRLSWAIKRITEADREIGIDTELIKRECHYK